MIYVGGERGVRMSVQDQRMMALYREIEQLKGRTLTDKGLDEADFALLVNEDMNQLAKWGFQTHSLSEWVTIIAEEFGELAKAVMEHHYRDGDPANIVKEATQVATLGLKVAKMAKEQLMSRRREVHGSIVDRA